MASGQTLILTEALFASKGLVMSRKVPGPHIAFYVPGAKWSAARASWTSWESKMATAARLKNAPANKAEPIWTIPPVT